MSNDEDLSYSGLTQLIEYMSTSILTAYHNHIQEHFEDTLADHLLQHGMSSSMDAKATVKDGVVELLEWLKEQGLPIAVATSTAKEVAQKKLELAGLSKYFDNLTTGCEVSHGKPDPEIYLLAASRLNVDPTKCIAFEDSNNGVRSAVAANMVTFQIPDLVEPCEEVRAFGHTIVPSLHHALAELKQA